MYRSSPIPVPSTVPPVQAAGGAGIPPFIMSYRNFNIVFRGEFTGFEVVFPGPEVDNFPTVEAAMEAIDDYLD